MEKGSQYLDGQNKATLTARPQSCSSRSSRSSRASRRSGRDCDTASNTSYNESQYDSELDEHGNVIEYETHGYRRLRSRDEAARGKSTHQDLRTRPNAVLRERSDTRRRTPAHNVPPWRKDVKRRAWTAYDQSDWHTQDADGSQRSWKSYKGSRSKSGTDNKRPQLMLKTRYSQKKGTELERSGVRDDTMDALLLNCTKTGEHNIAFDPVFEHGPDQLEGWFGEHHRAKGNRNRFFRYLDTAETCSKARNSRCELIVSGISRVQLSTCCRAKTTLVRWNMSDTGAWE